MKNKILILSILLTTFLAHSQKGIIRYGYIDAIGIGNANGTDSNAYMLFNKEQSYYVTAKDSLEDAKKVSEQKTYLKDDDSGGTIQNGLKVSKEGDQVVYHIKKKTMWSNLLYRKQIYIKELNPIINWKIEKERKKIGRFNCKKATANFRGRNYTAWFTTEIPLPFGPWKLNGLPGLILEAYDTNKFVYWYFKNVEYPTKIKNNVKYIEIPAKEKFITYTEFQNLQEKELDIITEKNKILKKQYPSVEFITPKMDELFIECE